MAWAGHGDSGALVLAADAPAAWEHHGVAQIDERFLVVAAEDAPGLGRIGGDEADQAGRVVRSGGEQRGWAIARRVSSDRDRGVLAGRDAGAGVDGPASPR